MKFLAGTLIVHEVVNDCVPQLGLESRKLYAVGALCTLPTRQKQAKSPGRRPV